MVSHFLPRSPPPLPPTPPLWFSSHFPSQMGLTWAYTTLIWGGKIRPDTSFSYHTRAVDGHVFQWSLFFPRSPAAQHYGCGRITWDRLRVCNKLCCTVPLRTKLMLWGFALCCSNYGLRLGAVSAGLRCAGAAPETGVYIPFCFLWVIRLPWQHFVI